MNYKSCEIVDDYTVKIYLTSPYAGFLYGVASRLGGICSKAYYEEVGDEGYLEAPVGTGPYRLVGAIGGEKIVLEAFDDYWRGEPAIKTVVIAIVPNVSTQMIGLEKRDYDAVRNPPIDACLHLEGQGGPGLGQDGLDGAHHPLYRHLERARGRGHQLPAAPSSGINKRR